MFLFEDNFDVGKLNIRRPSEIRMCKVCEPKTDTDYMVVRIF